MCSSAGSFDFGNDTNNVIIKETQQGWCCGHTWCIVTFAHKQFIKTRSNQFMRSSRQIRKGLVHTYDTKGKGGQGQDSWFVTGLDKRHGHGQHFIISRRRRMKPRIWHRWNRERMMKRSLGWSYMNRTLFPVIPVIAWDGMG